MRWGRNPVVTGFRKWIYWGLRTALTFLWRNGDRKGG